MCVPVLSTVLVYWVYCITCTQYSYSRALRYNITILRVLGTLYRYAVLCSIRVLYEYSTDVVYHTYHLYLYSYECGTRVHTYTVQVRYKYWPIFVCHTVVYGRVYSYLYTCNTSNVQYRTSTVILYTKTACTTTCTSTVVQVH